MNRDWQVQVLALLLVQVVGCGSPSVSGGWIAEETSAGDTLTVITTSGRVWTDSSVPLVDLTIGVLDGDSSLMFGEISRLAPDGSGGIYVFDRLAPILRHYDAAGRHIGDVGRAGEGPGEYQTRVLGMVVDVNGVLYLSDWGNARINRYTSEGQALESWPVDQPFLTSNHGRWVYSDGPDRVLLRARYAGRPAVAVFEGGTQTDTVWIPDLPGLPNARGGPYSVERHWGVHPDGHVVLGVNADYTLEHHRPSGVLRFGRRVEPQPVHPDEAAEIRRRFEWMEAQPSYRAPEGEWVPDFMPPFRGLQVADDGNVWVRRNVEPYSIEVPVREGEPPPTTWAQPHAYDVFNSQGHFLGDVSFPLDIEPLHFGGDVMWGVRRGDFDEEYVVRMRLTGGGV